MLIKAKLLEARDSQQIWQLSLIGEKQAVKFNFQMLDLLFHHAGKDESECCVCTLTGLVDLHPHKQIHHILYNDRDEMVKFIPREEDLKDAIIQKQKFRSHRMCIACFKEHFFRYSRNFCPVCVEIFSKEDIRNLERITVAIKKKFSNDELKDLKKSVNPKLSKANLDSERKNDFELSGGQEYEGNMFYDAIVKQ